MSGYIEGAMNILSWETTENKVLIRRAWGALAARLLLSAHRFLRLFPLSEIGVFPGDYYNDPK
jgi:hypothetical protein